MKVKQPTNVNDIDMTPMFEHDCKSCIFLGHVCINNKHADIYVCEDENDLSMSSLVYRHSSEDSDYGSIYPCYVSPLCIFASVALAMYVRYLECNSANGFFKGSFSKDGITKLTIK